MAQKPQKSVTKNRAKYRCLPRLEILISAVNAIDEQEDPDEGRYDFADNDYKRLCKSIHELAQMASLRRDMRDDYRKAMAGSPEEWDRFCDRVGVKLWRKWPEMDAWESGRRWPSIPVPLTINSDGLVSTPEQI